MPERITVPSRGAVLIGRRETLGAEYGVLPARPVEPCVLAGDRMMKVTME
jgi:hypothetical protein